MTSKPALGKEAVRDQADMGPEPAGGEAGWSRNKALAILTTVTLGLAVMSEILTDAIEPASRSLGLTLVFSGVFLLALVGNVAEIFNAVSFARSDKMDLSLGVTVGSSIQVALVVAPVLVFSGTMLGRPMNLIFTPFEIVAVGLSVLDHPPVDQRWAIELAGGVDARGALPHARDRLLLFAGRGGRLALRKLSRFVVNFTCLRPIMNHPPQ